MLSREGKQTDRGAVGAEFIGYNRRRREALLLQEFPHQPNCRPSVPAGLNQEIQDFALTVHGTPEIELPPSNYDDHLVQVPAFGRSWPPTLNPPRIGPTEFQDPSSNCLIRDVETTLGKQVLNVPIAQRETAIEPDGMLDDDRWKAVTTVGYLAHPETLKHRPCRSHAVNVTMPGKQLWSTASALLTRSAAPTLMHSTCSPPHRSCSDITMLSAICGSATRSSDRMTQAVLSRFGSILGSSGCRPCRQTRWRHSIQRTENTPSLPATIVTRSGSSWSRETCSHSITGVCCTDGRPISRRQATDICRGVTSTGTRC